MWGEWFNGGIDEVRVYAGVLTAAEIQADMNTAIPSSTDTIPPTVTLTSPARDSTVTGMTPLTATASDNVGVANVQFLLDGANLGAPDTTAPYELMWNTALASNAPHTVAARARDAAGNVMTSEIIPVAVLNVDTVLPTTPTNLVAQGSLGMVSLAWGASTDDSGVVVYNVYRSASSNVATTPANWIAQPGSPSYSDSALAAGTYYYVVTAQDPTGNRSPASNEASATATADTAAPTVAITSPTNQSQVSGVVPVMATATDDIGVLGVQFLLDGASLGSEDTAAPYEVSWNTASAANGSHTVTARARDASGKTTTSGPIVLLVSNTLPSGLVAAYGFNEGSGTSAPDASGRGHTGTISGATWEPAGKYGSALSFNGLNAMVTVADTVALDLTTMTLEAWVKPTTAPLSGWRTLILKESPGALAYALYANDASQRPRIELSSGLSTSGAAGLSTAWTHLAGTHDGATLRLYVNGVQVSSIASPGSVAVSTGALRIGGNMVWNEWFDGLIDEVRIYNRALTATEIQSDMNTAVAPDTVAPTVSITAPAHGSTVNRVVTLVAAANDNAGIAGVTFFVNGSQVGAEDTSAPYTASWDSAPLAAGSYTVTATARDTSGNTTTSSSVTVSLIPDFAFIVLTPSRQVATTGRTLFDIDVVYLNGFTSSNVNLWLSGVPAGVTGSYIFNPMAHQGRTSLIVDTNGVAPGTYGLTLGATAEGITHSMPATLVVTFGIDFAVSVAPSAQNINRGGTALYNIGITETNDFIDPVALSIAGLPAGVTASFSPPAPVPPANVVLSLTASGSAPTGTYSLTVSGTSGALVRTAPITLTVSAATATWSLATLGSTGELNNTVRVGALRTDGLERVYIGTIQTGRVLEYRVEWHGLVAARAGRRLGLRDGNPRHGDGCRSWRRQGAAVRRKSRRANLRDLARRDRLAPACRRHSRWNGDAYGCWGRPQ